MLAIKHMINFQLISISGTDGGNILFWLQPYIYCNVFYKIQRRIKYKQQCFGKQLNAAICLFISTAYTSFSVIAWLK